MLKNHESEQGPSNKRWILILFLGLLIIGFAARLVIQDDRTNIKLAHIGALGLMGLFGYWAGAITDKNGYGFWIAFLLGLTIPILMGVISVLAVEGGSLSACGGSVSITAGIFIVFCYSYFTKRNGRRKAES
jgi:hypothetical protein